MESMKLRMVIMIPLLKNSQNPILTPYLSADSMTIIFAIAPIMVAFPASVEAEAKANHKVSEFTLSIRGNINTV